MARMGMDVERVEAAANALKTQAGQLDLLTRNLDKIVKSTLTRWEGPDAAHFVNEGWPGYRSGLTAALQHIRGLIQSMLNNVEEQRKGSEKGRGVGGAEEMVYRSHPRPFFPAPSDVFDETKRMTDSKFLNSPWSYKDFGQFIPGVDKAIDVLDIAGKLSHGEAPIHEVVGVFAGGLRSGGPHLYLWGVALGTWNTAIEQAEKTDWSPAARDLTARYASSHPLESLSAATGAVVSFFPNLVANFKWW